LTIIGDIPTETVLDIKDK